MKDGGIFPESTDAKLLNGCYPRLYDKGISPTDYYPNYINTYVERDVRNIKDITDLGKRRGGGLFYTVKTEAGKEHRARAASLQAAA